MATFGTKLTVRDLIAKLQTMPPDAEVLGFDTDHSTTCSVDDVELNVINGEYAEEIPDASDLQVWCKKNGVTKKEAELRLTKTPVCVIHLDTGYSFSDGTDMEEDEGSDSGDDEESEEE